jgi:hypothetical protein
MSVSVLVPTIVLLSVAYVQPTAEVSYVEPVAQVSYVEASYQTQWLDIQVSAEVTMPDVLAVEIITPIDAISFQTYKNIAESLGVSTEFVSKVIRKTFRETLSLADVIQTTLIYQRAFTDAFTIVEKLSKDVLENKTDIATAIDRQYLATTKRFSDTVGMVDNMDTDIQYLLIKTMSELVSISDTSIISFGSAKADSVTANSAGLLVSQNYCDITYFLEDYVGTSRTFT